MIILSNKFYILLLIIIGVFLACGEEHSKPENILEREQIVDIIVELEITQALIKIKFGNTDLSEKDYFFEEIYQEFHTSEEQINLSLKYYAQYPNILEEIYNEVITKLTAKQIMHQNGVVE